jgi:hypothetical protein
MVLKLRLLVSVFLIACPVSAQLRSANGFTDQDIAGIFNGLSQHAAKVEPMLQELRPADWVAKGAPDTYVAQWNASLQQLEGIRTDMSAMAQHPDHMTDGLKAMLRVQATHQVIIALMGGLRRYQNPALADLIEAVAADDGADMERLQQYLLELASDKEQQFDVVDKEAQRCRGTLSRQPADASRPVRRP